MNKSIKELQQDIENLENQKSELENRLSQAITSALLSVAQRHLMQRISTHCYIIQFSELIGNPWSFEFYDWEAAAQVCMDYLSNKAPHQWIELLTKKLQETSSGPVVFTRTKYSGGQCFEHKIPVSREFLEQVIEKLK